MNDNNLNDNQMKTLAKLTGQRTDRSRRELTKEKQIGRRAVCKFRVNLRLNGKWRSTIS